MVSSNRLVPLPSTSFTMAERPFAHSESLAEPSMSSFYLCKYSHWHPKLAASFNLLIVQRSIGQPEDHEVKRLKVRIAQATIGRPLEVYELSLCVVHHHHHHH